MLQTMHTVIARRISLFVGKIGIRFDRFVASVGGSRRKLSLRCRGGLNRLLFVKVLICHASALVGFQSDCVDYFVKCLMITPFTMPFTMASTTAKYAAKRKTAAITT